MNWITERRPAPHVAIGGGLLLMLSIGWLDWMTGTELAFSIFYLIPILYVAWHTGRRWGIAFAMIGMAFWMFNAYWLVGVRDTSLVISLWNGAVRGGIFLITVLLLTQVREMLAREWEISALKTDMLAYVSDSFVNQMSALEAAISVLRDHDAAAEEVTGRKACEALERMHAMMRQSSVNLLNAARMDSGRLTLNLRPTDPVRLFGEALESLDPLLKGASLKIHREFPEGPILLRADPDGLILVMNILLNNAVKWSPKGATVSIRIISGKESADGAIVVEDSGGGISDEAKARLFSPFSWPSAETDQARGGFGLRLARDILESHGSRLEVSSDPGIGSRFFFRLPLWPSGAEAEPAARPNGKALQTGRDGMRKG